MVTSPKKRPLLSIPLLTTALIFLADPPIAILELLPDAIGYFLLAMALTEIADFVPHFAEAKAGFRKMALISLLKLPAAFFLFYLLGTSMDSRATIAVVCFAFAIVDLIFLLPALRNFFEGIATLTTRFDIPDIREEQRGISLLSVLFAIVKVACGSLPELTLLGYNDPLSTIYRPSLSSYFGALAIIAAVISLIFGVIFAGKTISYLKRISRFCEEAPILSAHRQQNEKVHAARTKRRQTALLCTLFAIAAFCACDLWLDLVNCLPDGLCGLFLLLFALFARRYQKLPAAHWLPLLISSAVYMGISLAGSVVGGIYAASYDSFSAIGRKILATKLYSLWLSISFAELAAALVMFFFLWRALRLLIHTQTGTPRMQDDPNAGEKSRLRRRALITSILGASSAALSTLYLFLQQFSVTLPSNPSFTDGSIKLQEFGWVWMPTLLVSILFFCFALLLSSSIKEETELRFPDHEEDSEEKG